MESCEARKVVSVLKAIAEISVPYMGDWVVVNMLMRYVSQMTGIPVLGSYLFCRAIR